MQSKIHKMFNWHRLSFLWQQIRYYLIFLVALWLSLGIHGCSFSQPSSPTVSLSPNQAKIASSTPQNFSGTTINIVTMQGVIGDAIKSHISKFESQTGVKINLTLVPFKNLYRAVWEDWSSSTPKYNAAVLSSQWMTDFVKGGYLENLTSRVQADIALEWQDIAPFFQKISANYQGRTYAIPFDGDFQMAYYRKDLLEQEKLAPPTTWEEYLTIAKQFQGKDLNGDGQPDYGSCVERLEPAPMVGVFGSILSSFLQAQGTAQGIFFDPETMKPLVNNQAFAKALEIYKQAVNYGYPQAMAKGFVSRDLFISGRCALTIDWGDIGTLATNPSTSKVIDKVGAIITPGTNQILDRKTNKLVNCDKFTCPYALKGVNHAPYAAAGGWAGFIHAQESSKVKEAVYSFFSFISQPAQSNIDVTIGETGFNPYRTSQFQNKEAWIKSGMSPDAASKYLGGISVSLNNPNMVLDLRIPKNQTYQQEILASIVKSFLEDKITDVEVMQQIEKQWEQITDEAGRDSQRSAYSASLGIKRV